MNLRGQFRDFGGTYREIFLGIIRKCDVQMSQTSNRLKKAVFPDILLPPIPDSQKGEEQEVGARILNFSFH